MIDFSLLEQDGFKHSSQVLYLNQKESHGSEFRRSRSMNEYEQHCNIIDMQSLKKREKSEKQHCSRKVCESKKSHATKEIVSLEINDHHKRSKSARPTINYEYKLNKDEILNEIKPERTQGAIFIEKLGHFPLKPELKPRIVVEQCEVQVIDRNQQVTNNIIEVELPAEAKKFAYELMIFEDDFKQLLESMLKKLQFYNNLMFLFIVV